MPRTPPRWRARSSGHSPAADGRAGTCSTLTCSIGIAIFPNDAEDGPELMKNADTAMYHAKETGRNNFQFFSLEMNLRAVERHQLWRPECGRALEPQGVRPALPAAGRHRAPARSSAWRR